jgi:hypothetical protein
MAEVDEGLTKLSERGEGLDPQQLLFQRAEESLDASVRLRRQLHRNATVSAEVFKSLTLFTHGTSASSNSLRTRTHGVKIGSTSTTNINN